MTDRTDSVTAVAARDTRLHRTWRLVVCTPLAVHAVVATVVLLLLMPLVNAGPTWSSDEGAVRAQVEVIATEGSWSRVRPFSEIDPEGLISPIYASTISGDQYFPYTKRPAYPAFLVPLRLRFGQDAVVIPSMVGTIIAALAGARIAGLFGERFRNVTFWILVTGSPLLFYAYTTTAHTVAAAFSTVALFFVIRLPNRPLLVSVIAGGSVLLAGVLRVEAAVFGLALALAVILLQPLGTRLASWGVAIVVASSAVLAQTGSGWAAVTIAGAEPVSDPAPFLDAGRLAEGLVSGLLMRESDRILLTTVVVMSVGGILLLATAVSRIPQSAPIRYGLAGVSVVGSLGIVLMAPEMITGLLPAMPLLLAGLVLVNRATLDDQRKRLVLLTSLLFIAGVVAVQVGDAGGAGWGGRYLLLVVPMLVAVAVASIGRLLTLNPSGGVVVVLVLAIATVALSANLVFLLRDGHKRVVLFNDRMRSFALSVGDGVVDKPLIVSSQTHIGRHVWMTIGDVDYVLAPAAEFDMYMRRLVEVAPPRFGLFGDWDHEREALFESIGYRVENGSEPPFLILVREDE